MTIEYDRSLQRKMEEFVVHVEAMDTTDTRLLGDIKRLYHDGCRCVTAMIQGIGEYWPPGALSQLQKLPLEKIDGNAKVLRAVAKLHSLFVQGHLFRHALLGSELGGEAGRSIVSFTESVSALLPKVLQNAPSNVYFDAHFLSITAKELPEKFQRVENLSKKMRISRNAHAKRLEITVVFLNHLYGPNSVQTASIHYSRLHCLMEQKPSWQEFSNLIAPEIKRALRKSENHAVAMTRLLMNALQNPGLSSKIHTEAIDNKEYGLVAVLHTSPYPSAKRLVMKYLKRLARKEKYDSFCKNAVEILNRRFIALNKKHVKDSDEKDELQELLIDLGVDCQRLIETGDSSMLPAKPVVHSRDLSGIAIKQPPPPTLEDLDNALTETSDKVESRDYDVARRALSRAVSYLPKVAPPPPEDRITKAIELFNDLLPHQTLSHLEHMTIYAKGTLVYRLLQFPELCMEQYRMALSIGSAHLKHQRYMSAVKYYAIAVQISRKHIREKTLEAHRYCSKALFQAAKEFCIDPKQFEEDLRKKSPEEFHKELVHLECLQEFAADEEDIQQVVALYHIADEVIEGMGPNEQPKYEHLHTLIQKGQNQQVASHPPLTQKLSAALARFRKGFKDAYQKASDMRLFQKEQTVLLRDCIRENFSQRLMHILPGKPCHFTLAAMGSIAREEPCPFSDFEWLLLIENSAGRPYFELFQMLLNLMITSLGETHDANLPHFTCLGSAIYTGFHLDSGDSMVDLICTPTFPKTAPDERSSFDPRSLENTLCRTCSIHEKDPSLHQILQAECRKVLDAPVTENLKVRENRALRIFEIRLADFKGILKRGDKQAIHIKEEYAEPLFHLLGDLALYHGITPTNTMDVVDALTGAFTPATRTLIKRALADIYKIRIRLHLEYGRQYEMASTLPMDEYVQLTQEEIASLWIARVLITAPLYTHLEKWMERGSHAPFQSVDLPSMAFMTELERFHQQPDLQKAETFVQRFKEHIGDNPDLHMRFYKILSQDVRSEPLRELYVRGFPDDSPLKSVPNIDGYRQSFRVGYERLDKMLELITTTQPEPGAIKVQVLGLSDEQECYLKTTQVNELLSQHLHIKKKYKDPSSEKSHNVMQLKGDGFDLHFKEMPSQPMMEFAMHDITSRLCGSGTTPTRLVHFVITRGQHKIDYPVLVSMTISGRRLSDIPEVITEGTTLQSATPTLGIDERSFTWMMIRAILIKPGDERRSNWILDAQNRLHCVDNDIALVETIVRTRLGMQQIFFKTLLPFLSDKTLDQEVIDEFLILSPQEILRSWLKDLIGMQANYCKLYKDREADLFTKGGELTFTPRILLRKGVIATLYTQFIVLQNFLRTHPAPTPIKLLESVLTLEGNDLNKCSVGAKLSRTYASEKRKPQTPSVQLQSVVKERADQSLTIAEGARATCGRTPKFHEVAIQGQFSPKMALEELELFVFRTYESAVEVTRGPGKRHLLANFSKIQVNGRPDLDRQRPLLQGLQCHQEVRRSDRITFENAYALTNDELKPFLNQELVDLSLNHCPELTPSSLALIAKYCPNIKVLRIENCPKITRIDDGGIAFRAPLHLPNLEKLYISHCPNLKEIQLKAPKLLKLKLNANPLLTIKALDIRYAIVEAKDTPHVDAYKIQKVLNEQYRPGLVRELNHQSFSGIFNENTTSLSTVRLHALTRFQLNSNIGYVTPEKLWPMYYIHDVTMPLGPTDQLNESTKGNLKEDFHATIGSLHKQITKQAQRVRSNQKTQQQEEKAMSALERYQDFKKQTFAHSDWIDLFGPVSHTAYPPSNLCDVLNAPCPIWEGKKVRETHLMLFVPPKVHGEPLSLEALEKSMNASKYQSARAKWFHVTQAPSKTIEAPYWLLITKDVLPTSMDLPFAEQTPLIEPLNRTVHKTSDAILGLPSDKSYDNILGTYEIPEPLEVEIAILAHFAKTGERLFVERHTRVGTPTDGELMYAVGGGPEAAFSVGTTQNFAADKDPMLGLALVRRFAIDRYQKIAYESRRETSYFS